MTVVSKLKAIHRLYTDDYNPFILLAERTNWYVGLIATLPFTAGTAFFFAWMAYQSYMDGGLFLTVIGSFGAVVGVLWTLNHIAAGVVVYLARSRNGATGEGGQDD